MLGPNGAGKTTLFNILIQTIAKTSGNIEWQIDNQKVGAEKLYQHLGIVFQSNRLDERLTVEENLITRGALYGMTKNKVLESLINIEDYLQIEELKKRKYGTLSGGQKRKVDIARALLHNPSILLLDEPTTGLDPKSRNDLWTAIYELNKKAKMTVVLITHYLEEMAFCDGLDVLIQGKLHYSGSIEDFIKENSTTDLKIVANKEKQIFSKSLQSHLTKKEPQTFVFHDVSMKEILNILSENQEVIESFEVQQASLEMAYLNLLHEIQGVKQE
nr:ABC transporter ATP-binding protein [Lactococcus allomyrinae]